MHVSGIPRRASLEVLRAEAAEELDTVVFERLRAGQDPWAFMELLPTVDELVVLTLRAELIQADGGRLPGRAVDYRMLRQIALAYPGLAGAIWSLLAEPALAERGLGERRLGERGVGERGVGERGHLAARRRRRSA